MSDPTRLSDEQIAKLIEYDRTSTATRTLACREVQEWRAFMLGGPCECASYAPSLSPMDAGEYPPCWNPACDGMGRVPGLIERLEAQADWWDQDDRPPVEPSRGLRAIIAEARRMVEP